jgi:CRISPR-associated protein Csm4
MDLFRIKLRPGSPWRTPWQADTIFGLLCWARARQSAAQVDAEIIEPSLAGKPPFVVSDAFPAGWMPAPVILRDPLRIEHYRRRYTPQRSAVVKRVRKTRWLTDSGFIALQNDAFPPMDDFASHDPIRSFGEINNQIGRDSNTTSSGGQLFVSDSWTLRDAAEELTVYVRTTDSYREQLALLFKEMSLRGFGADVSVGKGEFDLLSGLEPWPVLDAVDQPDASIVLSTFQPASTDPIQGYWESIIKHGKLGPDFGLDNVFKRPMVLLRPGAVFTSVRRILGRAIPMAEYLAPDVVQNLGSQQIRVIHPAFGLAVPAKIAFGASPASP